MLLIGWGERHPTHKNACFNTPVNKNSNIKLLYWYFAVFQLICHMCHVQTAYIHYYMISHIRSRIWQPARNPALPTNKTSLYGLMLCKNWPLNWKLSACIFGDMLQSNCVLILLSLRIPTYDQDYHTEVHYENICRRLRSYQSKCCMCDLWMS